MNLPEASDPGRGDLQHTLQEADPYRTPAAIESAAGRMTGIGPHRKNVPGLTFKDYFVLATIVCGAWLIGTEVSNHLFNFGSMRARPPIVQPSVPEIGLTDQSLDFDAVREAPTSETLIETAE